MTETIFGIDFGTTNSFPYVRVSVGDRVLSLVDQKSPFAFTSFSHLVPWLGCRRCHKEARNNMDLSEDGAPPGLFDLRKCFSGVMVQYL